MLRGVALLALAAIVFAAWFWWDMRTWRPSESLYPEQGAVVRSDTGALNFVTLKAIGAQFAYLELAPEPGAIDEGFAERYRRARAAQLQVGVIYPFDPCQRADPQSQLFTRMVPRDAGLLPPAIALTATGDQCAEPVSEAAVENEVLTLVNQIEMHAGKPAILKLGKAFEQRHGTATSLQRDLWLMRDRARPDYAPRPWLLWSANSQMVSEAAEEPVEWVVVQR
ncbi:glycoside hydrolase family 25 protein [Erythrobacter sp. JK5]|nr:glycoside hydrolase family 25 protein [Erythrobacter sp. JK5]